MKKNIRLIIYIILFICLISCFIYLGKKDFGNKVTKYSDSEKFHMEYNDIPINNMFKYANSNEVLNMFNGGKYILYIGFSSNEWSKYYIKNIYQVFLEENINEVYYYDILKDRMREARNYNILKNKLNKYLINIDDGSKEIYTPMLIIINNGSITFFNNDTAIITENIKPDEYWDEYKTIIFKDKIKNGLRSING